jgi:hypothetical protein
MSTTPTPNPFDTHSQDGLYLGYLQNCSQCGSYWKNIYSGIVYACRVGCTGSLPRDAYDDDADYCKGSALHEEVMEPLRVLIDLESAERDRINAMAIGTPQASLWEQHLNQLERVKAIHSIMAAHRLTDSAD